MIRTLQEARGAEFEAQRVPQRHIAWRERGKREADSRGCGYVSSARGDVESSSGESRFLLRSQCGGVVPAGTTATVASAGAAEFGRGGRHVDDDAYVSRDN